MPRQHSSSDAYQQLLIEFRDFWDSLGESRLLLETFSPGGYDSENPHPELQGNNVLCSIQIPLTREYKHFTDMSWVLGHTVDCPNGSLSRFKRLSSRAGAQLPATYTAQMRPFAARGLFGDESSISRWIGLLVFLKGIVGYPQAGEAWNKENPDTRPPYVEKHLIQNPVTDSIRMIEAFRLHTDSPVRVGDWFPGTFGVLKAGTGDPFRAIEKVQHLDAVEFAQQILDSGKVSRAGTQRVALQLLVENKARLPLKDLGPELGWEREEYHNNATSLIKRMRQHFSDPYGVRIDQKAIVITTHGELP